MPRAAESSAPDVNLLREVRERALPLFGEPEDLDPLIEAAGFSLSESCENEVIR